MEHMQKKEEKSGGCKEGPYWGLSLRRRDFLMMEKMLERWTLFKIFSFLLRSPFSHTEGIHIERRGGYVSHVPLSIGLPR